MRWICAAGVIGLLVYILGAEYLHIAFQGFPHGRPRDYDIAEAKVLRASYLPATLLIVWGMRMAVRPPTRRVFVALWALAICILFGVVSALNAYFYSVLDHGQGG
ncbi:MAG: hypothetical protein AAFY60_02580 [Myxococcota bacterium]